MEVILFTNLNRAIEVPFFSVHFFYRRTFYLCGAAEVAFPFFHMKKASVAKIQRSPRTFSKPMYGTRPWCLVQAITRHTCPDPHLGSWNCLPHQAHIAPSEPMSSVDQQGSNLGSFPTSPPFIPTLIGLRAFDHVSSHVWWEAATNKQRSQRTFSKPMYGTGPCCLVQAITRHTCLDPHLGSWNCLPHQAHFAPSEPMSSIDQQGSSLGRSQPSPPLYPHFNRPSGLWPSVKSCLVGGSDK